jgi:hypothetical protein
VGLALAACGGATEPSVGDVRGCVPRRIDVDHCQICDNVGWVLELDGGIGCGLLVCRTDAGPLTCLSPGATAWGAYVCGSGDPQPACASGSPCDVTVGTGTVDGLCEALRL